MSDWHAKPIDALESELDVDPAVGLSSESARRRREEFGPNELVERGLKSVWKILWEQFTATLVIVLIVAAVVSAALGDYKEAAAILVIVVLNALLGLQQEYRAEQAMAALKRMAAPRVKVRRDGKLQELSARELVPGDVVELEAGSAVPADGRLVESRNLRVQESTLTGESEPVEKDATHQSVEGEDVPLADRVNMVFLGTTVSYGRGAAVICETAMRTELGRIADMIQGVKSEPTPLQRRLDRLGKSLALISLVIVAVIFGVGLLTPGSEFKEMFLIAVSMAVAAVPEGLPAVVTIALALGAQRMLRRHALIRRLPAVETLGSVTTICSDKTGTLTLNEMTVTVLDVAGHRVDISERLARGQPLVEPSETLSEQADRDPSLTLLLIGGVLCNDASIQPDPGRHRLRTVGDPTEAALVVAGARVGLDKSELEQALPRLEELPFDSDRKRMTTIHACHGPNPLRAILPELEQAGRDCRIAIVKGAVDGLLQQSTAAWMDSQAVPLDPALRERIVQAHDKLAQEGVRVLGVAFRSPPSLQSARGPDEWEQDLVFVGLMGMIDPPRPEVRQAVQTCREAGIRPIMITGDHPLTALHIASQLGIAEADSRVVTGVELNTLDDATLEALVADVSIYARVSPEHKLRLVRMLQKTGEVVAMTGDGVNDAPALKQADIGVAMGITGTDVAKEAADAVLQDDNFATIVAAVKEGRIIYDNIRKFIRYTMTSNAGEILVMLLAPLLAMKLPLLPLQILWINLVTDGLPGLALGLEPGERDTMRRPPHPADEHVFARGIGWDILWIGGLMGAVSLAAGKFYWESLGGGASLGGAIDSAAMEEKLKYWRTIVFTVLTLSQMGNALATRSDRDSLFQIGLMSNWMLGASVLLTFVLQLAVIYTPVRVVFDTVPLSLRDLLLCLAWSSVVFWAIEAKKFVSRWLRSSHP